MQHGGRTKYHLVDPGWNYGETKWMCHVWPRRGHTRFSRYLHFWKREFVRVERRRGRRESREALDEHYYA